MNCDVLFSASCWLLLTTTASTAGRRHQKPSLAACECQHGAKPSKRRSSFGRLEPAPKSELCFQSLTTVWNSVELTIDCSCIYKAFLRQLSSKKPRRFQLRGSDVRSTPSSTPLFSGIHLLPTSPIRVKKLLDLFTQLGEAP